MNKRNRNFLLGLLIVVTMILLLNALADSKTGSREMAYSDFVAQVKQGQLNEVSIAGDRITGRLKNGQNIEVVAPADTGLVPLLRSQEVIIAARDPDTGQWPLRLFAQWGPLLLLVGVFIWFARKMRSGAGGKLFSLGKSRARRVDGSEQTVTFADVAGVEEAKEELVEIIEFLKTPNKYRKLGGHIPKGVLLVGPPGTGKTLLARAVSGEANVPFFSVSGSDFVEMFVGVGASRVRDLFENGRKNAPCILFVDEIDAVGRRRGTGLGNGHDEREQTLNQILVEMDGFETSEGVIVLAATNRADVLDPALLRPGRFDRTVVAPLPDLRGRERILAIHSAKVKLAKKVDLSILARGTPGFSGADLRSLVNEAALYAARCAGQTVGLKHLEWARDKLLMGPERRSLIMTARERKNTAYHEAGHAIVGVLLDNVDAVHKVTIVPRGQALGLTSFLPQEEQHNYHKDYLLEKIVVAMGGRAAEELVFGERTSGASGDIIQATQTARKMVTAWGMSRLGPLHLESTSKNVFLGRDIGVERPYGEKTAESVDEEVSKIIKSCYEKAKKLLSENMESLHTLAKNLIEKETIGSKELLQLLKAT